MYYTIDLVTILQLLHEFQQSGILRAELSSGLAHLKQPCIIMIELLRGEMTACYVKDTRGQTLLAGQEAFQAASAAGKLLWVFDALPDQELLGGEQHFRSLPGPSIQTSPLNTGPLQTPSAVPVPKLPANFSRVPRVPKRLMQLNHAEISAWSRRHRQVYILVDGVRSVEKIAAMLSQPSQLVEEVLREIEVTGAITLEDF